MVWPKTPLTIDGIQIGSKSQVRLNAEKDPKYRPYCLRCMGLQRMNTVAPFFWKCPVCGAMHDERTQP